MKSFGLTDKGKVRKDNQDCFIIESCPARSCLIAALCDGMGGENAGEIASAVANKAFVSYIYDRLTSRTVKNVNYKEALTNACAEANGVAYEYSLFDKAYSGMGTTLVGGVIKSGGNGYIINVGDSRAYHISRRANSIYQITRDHSLVEELVEAGAITKEQARIHPQKNVITRALGSEPEVRPDYFEFTLQLGDILLLCSDGLSNQMADQEILFEVVHGAQKADCCQRLLDIAKSRGAPDNVTSVLIAL